MAITIFNSDSFAELAISSMNRFRLVLFVRLLWELSHNMLSFLVCTQCECGCVTTGYISRQAIL